MYEVRLHPQVKKQLERLPSGEFDRVDKVIQQLHDKPRPYGVKKLHDKVHRLRVRDYRIIYSVFDDENVVFISKVARRSEKTDRGI